MEEVFLPILGGDEAEAAFRNELLDGACGHVEPFPLLEPNSQTHGPFEKEGDQAKRRELRQGSTVLDRTPFHNLGGPIALSVPPTAPSTVSRHRRVSTSLHRERKDLAASARDGAASARNRILPLG